jgi:DNA-binding response OmpR family regulator
MQIIVSRVAIPLESVWTPASLSVLLVSEDRDLREAAERFLNAAGCRTTTAAHDGHALLACMTDAPDVVVFDQDLAETSGDGIVRALRAQRPDLLVVRMCRVAPADAGEIALVRPFTGDDLLEAIRSAAVWTPLAEGTGKRSS